MCKCTIHKNCSFKLTKKTILCLWMWNIIHSEITLFIVRVISMTVEWCLDDLFFICTYTCMHLILLGFPKLQMWLLRVDHLIWPKVYRIYISLPQSKPSPDVDTIDIRQILFMHRAANKKEKNKPSCIINVGAAQSYIEITISYNKCMNDIWYDTVRYAYIYSCTHIYEARAYYIKCVINKGYSTLGHTSG
jgi:hypothetical protein